MFIKIKPQSKSMKGQYIRERDIFKKKKRGPKLIALTTLMCLIGGYFYFLTTPNVNIIPTAISELFPTISPKQGTSTSSNITFQEPKQTIISDAIANDIENSDQSKTINKDSSQLQAVTIPSIGTEHNRTKPSEVSSSQITINNQTQALVQFKSNAQISPELTESLILETENAHNVKEETTDSKQLSLNESKFLSGLSILVNEDEIIYENENTTTSKLIDINESNLLINEDESIKITIDEINQPPTLQTKQQDSAQLVENIKITEINDIIEITPLESNENSLQMMSKKFTDAIAQVNSHLTADIIEIDFSKNTDKSENSTMITVTNSILTTKEVEPASTEMIISDTLITREILEQKEIKLESLNLTSASPIIQTSTESNNQEIEPNSTVENSDSLNDLTAVKEKIQDQTKNTTQAQENISSAGSITKTPEPNQNDIAYQNSSNENTVSAQPLTNKSTKLIIDPDQNLALVVKSIPRKEVKLIKKKDINADKKHPNGTNELNRSKVQISFDKTDIKGNTPLMIASLNSDLETVISLIEQGANLNQTNKWGWTSLLNAAIKGNKELVDYLLKQGANPNITDNDGRSPLMAASWNRHPEIVASLLQYKADVNRVNQDGWSALSFAAWQGDVSTVDRLLKANAKTNVKTMDGLTPLMIAKKHSHTQVQNMLK